MDARRLIGRTVIVVVTDDESVKGTVDAATVKDSFVLDRPALMTALPSGEVREQLADGNVWVPTSSVRWVQVI